MRLFHHLSALLLLTSVSLPAQVNLHLQAPGTLSAQLIGSMAASSLTTLTLSGTLAEADLDYAGTLPQLQSIDFEETQGIYTLKSSAFRNHKQLRSIALPATLKSISLQALDCPALQTIKIAQGNPYFCIRGNALYEADGHTLLQYPAGRTESLYTLPEGTREIGEFAFVNNQVLTGVTLPDGVLTIGDGAFMNCTRLSKIYLPPTLQRIGPWAFKGTGLIQVNLPKGGVVIEDGAFMDCAQLQKIETPVQNVNYCSKDGVLYGKNGGTLIQYPAGRLASNYTIPEGTTALLFDAFKGSRHLQKVQLPTSISKIGAYAFEDCSGLTQIVLPSGIRELEIQVFHNCTALEKIELSSAIAFIGYGALQGCSRLKTLNLPAAVTHLGEMALNGCTGLKSIILHSSVPSVCEANTFNGIDKNICQITVPKGSLSAYRKANGWKQFKNIKEK